MLNYLLIPFLMTFVVAPSFAGFSNQIARTVSNNINKSISDNYIRPTLKIKNPAGSVLSIATDPNQQLLAMLLEDGSIRVWDLALGIQRPAIAKTATPYTQIVLDAQRQLVFAGQKSGQVKVFDILTATLVHTIPAADDSHITALALSQQGLLLVAYKDDQLAAFDVNSYKSKWQISIGDGISGIAILNEMAALWVDDQDILLINLERGHLIKQLQPLDEDIVHLSTDHKKTGYWIAYEDGNVLLIRPEDGQLIKQRHIIDDLQVLGIADADRFAAYSSDSDQTIIKNTELNTEIKLQTNAAEVKFIDFNQLKNKVFVLDQQGGVNLYDARTGSKDLQIISTLQGWTVLDKNGRFDSSEPGLANVSWEMNDLDVPLDKFSEQYYDPGLLAIYLKSSDQFFQKNPAVVQERVTLPPVVQISLSTDLVAGKPGKLTVIATGRKGGVERINVFHNGKALPIATSAIKIDKQNDVIVKTLVIDFIAELGPNTLEAMASNNMGIESKKAVQTVTVGNVDQQQQKNTMRIVAVGVNNYADPRLNLDYSVADAHSVAETLKNKKITHINKVEAQTLYNRDATKQAIITAIREAGSHQQSDVLAIYFAGHGIVVDGEWYFLPHETTLHSDPGYFATVGVSGAEIKDLLIAAKAQKIIVLIDACYSGAGLDAFNYLINAQRYMGRNLSRSVGIVVLTSARKDQLAAELSDLGHGLFTYYLTKGMAGEADEQPVDKKITAYEVVDFPKQHIPFLSKKYVGASQDPMVFKMGMDFDLLAN